MTAGLDLSGPLGIDTAAAKALVNLFEDIARNKATISEAIAAGVTTAKALAQYVPAAQQVLTVLEAAQALDAVYEMLPENWRFIKVHHGPLKPIFGGPDMPETIFGHEILKEG